MKDEKRICKRGAMTKNRHDKYCLPLLQRVDVLLELGEREARREKMLA